MKEGEEWGKYRQRFATPNPDVVHLHEQQLSNTSALALLHIFIILSTIPSFIIFCFFALNFKIKLRN